MTNVMDFPVVQERGILFSEQMVLAIDEGRKKQTRRVVNPQPLWVYGESVPVLTPDSDPAGEIACPYGKVGDLLWVRETFYAWGRWERRFSAKKGRDEFHFVDMTREEVKTYFYAASSIPSENLGGRRHVSGSPAWWKRPALFMPREASRILLRLTSIRVERVQEITESDAILEGAQYFPDLPLGSYGYRCDNRWSMERPLNRDQALSTARMAFANYLCKLASKGDIDFSLWDSNGYVWVLGFERMQLS